MVQRLRDSALLASVKGVVEREGEMDTSRPVEGPGGKAF